jgi:hypothetical protein
MILFFAAVSNSKAKEAAVSAGVRNYLLSYAGSASTWKLNEDVLFNSSYRLLVDSGAFTEWRGRQLLIRKGKDPGPSIDVESYAQFCLLLQAKARCECSFVNLDVIPGEWQVRPTYEQREAAYKKGWENYEYLVGKGVKNVVPVFHQHEMFSELPRFCEAANYVGISPANDVSTREKDSWLSKVMGVLGPRIWKGLRTHAFGVNTTSLLQDCPFYSADSTTWLNGAKYFTYCQLLRETPTFLQIQKPNLAEYKQYTARDIVVFSRSLTYRYMKGCQAFLEFERFLTGLWAQRGLVWDTR